MALAKAHDRCIRRHRKCLLFLGVVIFFIQVLIVCVVFSIDSDDSNNSQEPRDLSGKGRINVETLVEDPNGPLPSRRLKETFLSADDEDINALYSRQKVPPDKNSVHGRQPSWRASALGHRTTNSASARVGSSIENNKTSLRLEELDFIPNCEINSKEAVSAVHRAKTQFCKQAIANVTCLINGGELFPKELPSSCPSKGYTTGKPLGCYKDDKNYRTLSGYYVDLKSHNSPQHCINMCLQSGFLYAGVQYSTECFCGNTEPPSNARLPDSSCNMKCPSDPRKACGGYYSIDVYQTGIAKFAPQVPNEAVQNPQIPVRIVYLLTLNGRAVRQVRRLIKVLFHRDHYFYIHVDARQEYLYRELLSLESQFSNIRLARQRYATIWGGASLLRMLLSSMSELLTIGWDWDFVINLSESDFPIKTNAALVNFLSANKGYNFVKSHGRETQRFVQKQGLDKAFVECEAHMWRVGDRRLPWGIQVDGGSDWVALSRPFVEYVAKEQSVLVDGLMSIFKYTLLPAESFFHTALRNSRFCGTYIDNNLHVTNWKRRLGCKCQYKHVVDWCGCSPNVFKPEDWPRLLGTENRHLYFARKFDPSINQVIIDKVEAWLDGAKTSHLLNQLSYWQSVYHHADQSPPADDALVTLANSLARRAVKKFLADDNECPVKLKNVLEVTSYHHSDSYMGALVLYEVSVTATTDTVQFESWVRPESRFSILKHTVLTQRLLNVVVSSEYDMKEQMARNFLRVLGPFSEPVLIANFEPNTTTSPLNLTFLWIDPAGHLAEVSEMHIEEGLSVGHVKLSLQQPLLPGSWEVRLVMDKTVLALVRFLVTPQEFMSGTPMLQQQARILHSGAGVPYRLAHLEPDWESVMDTSAAQRTAGERRVLANSRRFGKDLQNWVDALSQQFYPLVDICISSTTVASKKRSKCATKWKFKECQSLSWSSLTSDPKSQLSGIDESTGRLHKKTNKVTHYEEVERFTSLLAINPFENACSKSALNVGKLVTSVHVSCNS